VITPPFLKWAGGKRWLVDSHKELFDRSYNTYIEPFAGSAAVFFYLLPKSAILADKNKSLMDVYRAIKGDWKKVKEILHVHSEKHSSDYYYFMRSNIFSDEYQKAAQFIYLNRTCWNGIYRVNKAGIFNVPIGTKENVSLKSDDFEKVSDYLKNTEIIDGDFEQTINMATKNDLLFVDPPYTANHNNNGFLKYNEKIFTWEDQVRLSESVKKAKTRGARIVLTNADHESIRDLYRDDFDLYSLSRSSVLSGKSQFRKEVTELLVLG